MTTNEQLIGKTVHILRGTKYQGAYEVNKVEDAGNGWLWVYGSGVRTSARPEDMFATEAEARTEAKARRKPRQARRTQPLYGDYATIAMLNGIRTDGSGKLALRHAES